MANDVQSPSTSLVLPSDSHQDVLNSTHLINKQIGAPNENAAFSSSNPSSVRLESSDNVRSVITLTISNDDENDVISSTHPTPDNNNSTLGRTQQQNSSDSFILLSTDENEGGVTRTNTSEQSFADRGSPVFSFNYIREFLNNWLFVREVMTIIMLNILPFILLVLCKQLITSFMDVVMILVGFVCFHLANRALIARTRGRRYLHLAESTAFIHFFMLLNFIVFGTDNFPLSRIYMWSAHSSFFSTLCAVLLVDFIALLLTVQTKVVLALIPSSLFSNSRCRQRIYQWLEYTSQICRCVLPMPQWYQFFVYSNSENKTVPYSDMMLAGLYLLYKVMMLPYYFLNWYNSTRSMCGLSLVGTVPSHADLAHFSQCTICVSNAVNPLKLPCGHVFCRQCIHTWLETENTCPNCRKDTPTPLQDVSWKGGGTTYFLQFC